MFSGAQHDVGLSSLQEWMQRWMATDRCRVHIELRDDGGHRRQVGQILRVRDLVHPGEFQSDTLVRFGRVRYGLHRIV